MEKGKIYVVGHKSPDTDSICSAIAYAEFLKKKGKNAVACRTGEINPETKFVLGFFKVKSPKFLASAKGKEIVLIDHNEKNQAPNEIEKAEIIEVIDHHKINFEYESPISFHTEPLGSASTLIAKKYFEDKKVKLSNQIAGILLSAILSDTVVFRSPTTTKKEVEFAERLARIAKVKNIEEFGIEIKKAKSDLRGMKLKDIILSDFKAYNFGKIKLGVGQIEIYGLKETEEKKEKLLLEIKKMAKKENYDLLILMATDIIKMGSLILFWEKKNYIEKTFGKKPENNAVYLEGVLSRKKQIIPPLTKLFQT